MLVSTLLLLHFSVVCTLAQQPMQLSEALGSLGKLYTPFTAEDLKALVDSLPGGNANQIRGALEASGASLPQAVQGTDAATGSPPSADLPLQVNGQSLNGAGLPGTAAAPAAPAVPAVPAAPAVPAEPAVPAAPEAATPTNAAAPPVPQNEQAQPDASAPLQPPQALPQDIRHQQVLPPLPPSPPAPPQPVPTGATPTSPETATQTVPQTAPETTQEATSLSSIPPHSATSVTSSNTHSPQPTFTNAGITLEMSRWAVFCFLIVSLFSNT